MLSDLGALLLNVDHNAHIAVVIERIELKQVPILAALSLNYVWGRPITLDGVKRNSGSGDNSWNLPTATVLAD